jgi:hypothetical protein
MRTAIAVGIMLASAALADAPPPKFTGSRAFKVERVQQKYYTKGSLVVTQELIVFRDRQIPAKDVTRIVYERGSTPRYLEGLLFAWPLLFTKSKQHYVTIHHGGDFSLFQADKESYRDLLAALESVTGKTAERHEER